MAVRKSQQKCVNKYISNHYDRINLTVTKGKKAVIQSKAAENGESINAYINRAVDMLMSGRGSYGISNTENINNDVSRSISHIESLFTESELKEITALLEDGQTIGDYIKLAVLDRIRKNF